eukprot:CAMPEP_0117425898 /NCGR_PEP_ID=MMETSP0758-20121206/6111_1 /TAXON_ID=63605 /ORGANISM="Percolomonas cosmopolitus, Strain AE-1 (ATCC 50343)" /LENGTH=198 /DNA_ID=CAMNT_0005210725 /DNA_START=275 /DNA_END=868 /DNA_ORIENTATION=-
MRDSKFRTTWDTRALANILEEVIETANPVCGIQTMRKLGQYVVSNREFLSMTTSIQVPLNLKFEDGDAAHSYYFLTKSIDDLDDKYPPHADFVRGFIHYFKLKIEPARVKKGFTKATTKFSGVIAIDMAGWVPTYAYNWGVTYLPQEYQENIMKGCAARKEDNRTAEEWIKQDPLLNIMPVEELKKFRAAKRKMKKKK